MNINTHDQIFYNDLNKVIEYRNHKYCFDNMVYTFKDKYRLMNKDTLSQYYKEFINMNKSNQGIVEIVYNIM